MTVTQSSASCAVEMRGAADVRAAVDVLAAEARARAAETNELRAVPADLMTRIKAAGLCQLLLPETLGGLELDPLTVVEMGERLAEADGSTAWTTMIGNSTLFFAWLDPDVARDMLAGEAAVSSTSMFAPLGRAVPTSRDAVKLSGRWPFNSGCDHAEWNQVGMFVMDGARPRLRADGRPDWRFAFLRRDVAVRHDTWHALGLRGTASHDLSVDGLEVPVWHTAGCMLDPARHDGPLWRLPTFALLNFLIAGFPLGVARRALDEFALLAPAKRRGSSPTTIAEDGYTQYELGRCEAAIRSARSFVIDKVGEVWTVAEAGDVPSAAQIAELYVSTQNAMNAAIEAVDACFTLAGAGAVYDDHPLQRCFRDLHTARQHIAFNPDGFKSFAQGLFA
jgi:alkylation response protein AidB-like acyl-CoA dehydrogenase